jgi:hypothetical protein
MGRAFRASGRFTKRRDDARKPLAPPAAAYDRAAVAGATRTPARIRRSQIMIRTTKALAAVLVVFASLAGCSTEPAKPAAGAPGSVQKPLELITFPGGFNWPVWVAQDKGLFAKNGVAVKVTPTPNSVFQLTQPNATQQSAETAYRVLLDPKDGFQRRAQIDLQGVANVLAIRMKWAEKKKPLAQPGAYYDPSFYQQAVGR